MMSPQALPPTEVNLIYRNVGKTHVFTALELPGFHIGSSKLEHVFKQATDALNEHVSRLYKCDAKYQIEFTYEAFRVQVGKSTGKNFVARREHEHAA
jgi:hypothetical protein